MLRFPQPLHRSRTSASETIRLERSGPCSSIRRTGWGMKCPQAPDMKPPTGNARQRACEGHGTV